MGHVGHVKWQSVVSRCWGADFANFLQSQWLQTSKLHVAFRLAQSVESFMKWVSMAEQLHPRQTSASAMQSVGTVWGRPLPVPTWLHQCTKQVHKHMDERVWCGWTWLVGTQSWPQPDRTPLGWIRAQTEPGLPIQHQCVTSGMTFGRMVKNSYQHS